MVSAEKCHGICCEVVLINTKEVSGQSVIFAETVQSVENVFSVGILSISEQH